MMPRGGNNKKPTALKILQGTAQPCRMNEAEPMPAEDKVEAPADLNAVAKKHFNWILEMLEGTHVVLNSDVPALADLCRVFAERDAAYKKMNGRKKGEGRYTVNAAGSTVETPWLKVWKETGAQYHRMLVEFGLTPASRSKIIAAKPKDKPKEDDDPMARLARGKK